MEATVDELVPVVQDFVPAFAEAIHDGEKEALGLLLSGRCAQYVYCSGDVNAMQAAGMLGLEGFLVSLETVVSQTGLKSQLARKLPVHLTDKTLQKHLSVGKTRRITREYFKN